MKKLATFVFAMLLVCSLSFAQGGGTSGDTKTGQGTTDTGKKGKSGKKAHKGGKKSKKGQGDTAGTSTPK